jgi:hypothetical protein
LDVFLGSGVCGCQFSVFTKWFNNEHTGMVWSNTKSVR